MEKCSCNQSLFYRAALRYVKRVSSTDTRQTQWDDLSDIQGRALAALDAREPGGEPPCGCEESQHLAKALRACVNVARDGEGQKEDQPIHDVAQCANFADQGLKLEPITGDPGVYDCSRFIPGEQGNGAWSLGDAVPEEIVEAECPACGGEGAELGVLGNRRHFRCRSCGADFSNER